jgi:MFS family permease
MGFSFSSLNSAQLIWVGRSGSQENKGAMFGLSTTARSIGWSIGPLIASSIADMRGYFAVYDCVALTALIMAPVMILMSRRYSKDSIAQQEAHADSGAPIAHISGFSQAITIPSPAILSVLEKTGEENKKGKD